VAESFLPPVTFQLGSNTAEFVAGLDKAITKLRVFGTTAEETAALATEAFAAIGRAAAEMAATVAESSDTAKKGIRQVASAARALTKSVNGLAEAAPKQMAAVGAAATEMATTTADAFARVGESAKAASTSIKGAAAVTDEAAVATTIAAGKTEASVGRLGAASETAFGTAAAGLKKYAMGLAAAGGVGVFEAVKGASTFEAEMTKLYTAAGLTDGQLKSLGMTSTDLNKQVLALGNQVGVSGTQMAEALYHPISASLDLKSALEVTKYSAMETKISGASLEDTTYSLSSVMKAFNQSASDAGPTMASLNAIVGQGDMRFQDFNQSVKNWAPTAAQMGISIDSMGAGLAYLTDRGNSAEVAATRMTMGISMMTTPSAKATVMLEGLGVASSDVKASSEAMQEAMQQAGITQNQLALDLQKPDGLYVALNHLKTALEKAGVSGTEADSVLSKIFGGGRSDKAIMSLMQNLDGLKGKFEDIQHAANMSNFQSAYEKSQQTFSAQLERLKANFENLGITIGTMLMPYVEKFLSWIQKGIGWISQHQAAVQALAAVIGTVLVGAVVTLGASMLAAFGWAEAIAMAILAAGAAAVYAYTHFKTFRTIVDDLGRFLAGAFKVAWSAAAAVIDWFRTSVLPPLKTAIEAVFTWFEAHKEQFRAAWDTVLHAVQVVAQWFNANVLTWIKARVAELVAWWTEHSHQIHQVWSVVWKIVETAVKVWWDGFMRPTLSVIQSVWTVVWGVIKDTIKIAWDLISGIVTTAIHYTLNTITLVLDILTFKWGRVWGDLGRLVGQALNDVISTIGRVASGFGDLLWDAGANIIRGLINGIKSMGSGVGRAMGDIASTIRGYLPFSPAKVGPLSGSGSPDLAGAKIGSMVADGLHASVGTVSAATGRLAGAAALTAGGMAVGGVAQFGLAPAAGAMSAQPTYVINVTVQGSVHSERDLRDVIERQMYQLGMRGSSTWQPYARR
jgi:TP901 family phage tail tape measure protein